MEHGLVMAGLALTLLIALLGWVYQLGFMGARVIRNEKDVAEIKSRQEQNEKDLRTEVKDGFSKVYQKIDDLPCHNPGWRKDHC
jgi:hypothetical protein